MFGGRVVNVPCSHAAHFEAARYRDYRLAWGLSIVRNYRRVSDVWFGNYSRYFYMYKRGAQVKTQSYWVIGLLGLNASATVRVISRFTGGGNRSSRRKPPTYGNKLPHIIWPVPSPSTEPGPQWYESR